MEFGEIWQWNLNNERCFDPTEKRGSIGENCCVWLC
jgi:hypothetical protein